MTDRKVLARIQQALTPFDVYLKEAKIFVASDYDARYGNSNLTFQIRFGVQGEAERLEVDGGDEEKILLLRYVIDTGVRFVDEDVLEQAPSEQGDAEPAVRAELTATWLVEYQIVKPEDVDDTGIRAFSEDNVMYHAWPYWREFIHATCARLRLPLIVLPTYRVRKGPTVPEIAPQSTEDAPEAKPTDG